MAGRARAMVPLVRTQLSRATITTLRRPIRPFQAPPFGSSARRPPSPHNLTWLRQCTNGTPPPTTPAYRKKLMALGLITAVPMVGFGFADNFIMIIAGDAIDASLGVKFGISTLAAAGLGNLISDVAGVGIGDMIESAVIRMGMVAPEFSAVEGALLATRLVKTSSSVFGIAIGCLLGMCPLLLIQDHKIVHFDDDELLLHTHHFAQVGLEQYFRLMRIATWHTVEAGHKIVNPGPLTRVVILHDGKAHSVAPDKDSHRRFLYSGLQTSYSEVDRKDAQLRGCVIGGTALVDPQVLKSPYPNEVHSSTRTVYVEFQLEKLKEMMEEDPAIAAAVYHCLFKDRVAQKNHRTVQATSARESYRLLLSAVLADGFVHPQEREVCASWRAQHPDFTDSEHGELLAELGWTIDQWQKVCC
eukprot:TRINITY_DN22016_c0_g1_i2.p1 TRINITY_DN22016_c0_g1~~TRINITY_DN22016_c0_g1_i2.p1  ORF type:complete len:415 (+),score=82.13 TRINITY_DN22016_c0_g1_i2:225-1469(+)